MTANRFSDLVAESEIVAWLRRLVAIDSSNPPPQEEPVARMLQELLSGAGLHTVVDVFAPGRANVVATWRGQDRKPALLLSGHLDTVPAGSAGWDFPPHSAIVKDGILYGLGSVDMKGALAAMAAACLALARSERPLAGDVIFAGTAGEEVDSAGAKRLLTRRLPVIGAIMVGEPTRLDVAAAHKGALWLEIETHGQAAHASMPEQGCNAILAMHDVMAALTDFRSDSPLHPLLGRGTQSIGTIQGGLKPNIVPDQCLLTIDIRTLPGESHAELVEKLAPALGQASIRILNSMPAVETPLAAPLIQSALRVARKLHGTAVEPRGMSYYSDASILYPALRAPVLIFGPGDERLAHRANECIQLREVFAAARFYFELMQEHLQ